MAKAIDVAKYLIFLRDVDSATKIYYSLSNLKLQKLLYFCQGGHYRWDNRRLITDKYFEAWRYGATIPCIYKKFSKYGQSDIYISEREKDRIRLSVEEKETIEAVWFQCKNHHSFSLVESILSDCAHENAYQNDAPFIMESDIENCFSVLSVK